MIKIAMLCGYIAAKAQGKQNSIALLETIQDLQSDFNNVLYLVSSDNSWLEFMDSALKDETPQAFFSRKGYAK